MEVVVILVIDFFQGNSIEPQTKTVAPKHGMQSLGKVPSARRAPQPVNLPSLKSESGVNVPETSNSNTSSSANSGGSNSATAPTSSTTTQSTPNPAGWTGSVQEPTLSAVATNKPPQSQSPAPSGAVPAGSGPYPVNSSVQQGAAPVQQTKQTIPISAFLEKKFQQEFPSLTPDSQPPGPPQAKRAAPPQPAPPTAGPAPVSPSEIPRQESPQPLQYGPGPSLRPQTEGSWVQGGRPSNIPPSQGAPGSSSFFV